MKWGPRKPKESIRVADCGSGIWDDHGLDIPHDLETFNFRVTGTGHERIEGIFQHALADRRPLANSGERQPEHIAAWLSRHACSFVLFDTKARNTVIGFEREDDANAFRREFVR